MGPLRFRVRRSFLVGLLMTLGAGMTSAENASNPLASVSNLDTKMQYTYADPVDRYDVFLDGAQMLMPVLKLKYELHYNFTDATGSDENDFEKLVLKPIYFPSQSKLNEDWGLPILYHAYSRIIGIWLMGLGPLLWFYCVSMLRSEGKGTPLFDVPTTRLVIKGPYRYSRNPLYVSYMLVLFGLCLFRGHLLLFVYSLFIFFVFDLFISKH